MPTRDICQEEMIECILFATHTAHAALSLGTANAPGKIKVRARTDLRTELDGTKQDNT